MGHVAAALGIDPIEVALKNDGCEGRDMSYLSQFKIQHGFPDRDSLKECIDAGKAAIDWDNKWHHPGEKMLPNGKMHGISMVWTHDWDSTRGVGMAGVLIHHDGSVDIISQKADIGVNHDTTYTQIVADELGMRYEDVNFRSFNDVGFQLMTADGSCNLCSNGYVVRKAAKRCKQRLLEAAITPCLRETAQFSEISWEEYPAAFPGMKPEDLDVKDSYVFEKANPENRVTVADVVQRTPQTSSAYQEPVYAYAWRRQGRFGSEVGVHRLLRQAHFMEVEVDTETGEVNITNVVNVNDVGKAVSPETVEGQMYGGMYMAVGGSRSERMIYDPSTAVLLNGDLEGYKWSTIEDIGNIETIIVETSLGYGPYGAGGVGENVSDHPVTLLGLALHNAIDKWVDSYPITPDKVLKALGKI